MSLNPFVRLLAPSYPSTASGLESDRATVVQLERERRSYRLRRAATIALPKGVLQPGFAVANIPEPRDLGDALVALAGSAGLGRQKRWSVTLPAETTRSSILTLETAPASGGEQEEMLNWKIERAFGFPRDELRVSRESLPSDSAGRSRYLATAVNRAVLAEYEAVFDSLNWQAGLVTSRHAGEGNWLAGRSAVGRREIDSLLVSSHESGFTAIVMRGSVPLLVRSVTCDPEDRNDELFRVLLFYRDRLASDAGENGNGDALAYNLERLMVTGPGFSPADVSMLIDETLGTHVVPAGAEDVGLAIPPGDLEFDDLVAPAGLAALAWR